MPKKIDRTQEFTFAIKKHLGIIGTTSTGWTKEVNLVEWNGNPAKLDVRDWDPNHEHMGKGITMHKPETLALLEILLKNFGKDLAWHIKNAKEEETPVCDEDGVCVEEPVQEPVQTDEPEEPDEQETPEPAEVPW